MALDWSIVATIGAPLLALVVGAALERFLERKPKLVAYLSHTSAFQLRDENRTQLNTHSVVVRNTGRRPAKNVRLHHSCLPEHYNIYPSVTYNVEPLPDGGSVIHIPKLVPKEQVTIQYLYTPPITWNQVNGTIKHDEGFAEEINVLLQRQYSPAVRTIIGSLMILGAIAAIYLLVLLAKLAL